jgi:FkbM family methyltransferase
MKEFIWEPSDDHYKISIQREIFVDKCYEKMFEVEEGDVVFDIGASLGPFTYSILHKNPSHVFCVEPSYEEFKTLILNTNSGPVTYINKGISDKIGEFNFNFLYEKNENYKTYSTTFKKIIEDYNLSKIDFLKTDCEGGEYDIFNIENFCWIKNNVKKITGEFHLSNNELKEKFKLFRDTYLKIFKKYTIYSFDGVDITWSLWDENFIPYYNEITIHIDNRDY